MTIYTNPQATTEENLSLVLDVLCQIADRNICVFLPEKEEERIPYLKKEILITLEKIK